ncbi:MAG: response regulator [Methylococcaceae bacterium]|nr:response regulator [Methylococcaceae bacterium]
MDIDSQLMQQLQLVFKVELEEHLQVMSDGLLALEQGLEADAQQILMEEVFRAAHSLKGAARSVSQPEIAEITHCLESIFSLLKKEQLVYSTELFNALLQALDNIKLLSQNQKSLTATQLKALLETLRVFLRPATTVTNKQATKKKSVSPAIVTEKKEPAIVAIAETIVATLEKDIVEEPLIKATSAEDATSDKNYTVLAQDVTQLSLISEELQISKLQLKQHTSDFHNLCLNLDRLMGNLNESFFQHLDTRQREKINVISSEINHEINQSFSSFHNVRQLNSHFQLLAQDLEYNVNKMRLVPFSVLLAPLQRIVRDLSQQQDKQINFTITGSDIKIDRHLYKTLHNPLLHLINNAIDHGIESKTARVNKGKNPQAQLSLVISKTGYNINILLSDDGKGINLNKVKQKIVKQKMLSVDDVELLSEEQILDFLFKQGFSLSEIITDISGRGVGLDIVKTNLLSIKGDISVKTKLDKGTEFLLNLPALLTSESGVLISLNQQKFTLQGHSIERVENIHSDKLVFLNNQLLLPATDLNANPISFYYLAELLQISEHDIDYHDLYNCIFISDGQKTIALIVDEIIGELELIIKPFSYPLVHVPFAVGMTTLGSGELVPVLNANELINSAFNTSYNLKPQPKTNDSLKQNILVVDDSNTSRTLEKNILEQHGYQVTALINGQLAWEELQHNNAYDLIITDVEMPLMNGFELVEKIKNQPSTEAIPTIIVSSLNSEQDKRRGIQVGADAYITKDLFDSDKLLTIINQLL